MPKLEIPKWVSRSISPAEQAELMCEGEEVLFFLAGHPDLLPEHQVTLASHDDKMSFLANESSFYDTPRTVRQVLAKHPTLCVQAQEKLAATGPAEVRDCLAENAALAAHLFPVLLEQGVSREELLYRGVNFPDDLWAGLKEAAVSDVEIRRELVTAARATLEELLVFARDPDSSVRAQFGDRFTIPQEVEEILARDEEESVLSDLTDFPASPSKHFIGCLLQRPDTPTTSQAKSNLLFMDLVDPEHEHLLQETEDPGLFNSLCRVVKSPDVAQRLYQRAKDSEYWEEALDAFSQNPDLSDDLEELLAPHMELDHYHNRLRHKRLPATEQLSVVNSGDVYKVRLLAVNPHLTPEVLRLLGETDDFDTFSDFKYNPSFTWGPWMRAEFVQRFASEDELRDLIRQEGGDVEAASVLLSNWEGSVTDLAEATRLVER